MITPPKRRKPRKDSRLKNQPPEVQARCAELYRKHGDEAPAMIHEQFGIPTSATALSEFYSWYLLEQQFAQDASTTEQLLEHLKRTVPEIPDAQLEEYGLRTFSLLSIQRQDPETFVAVRSAKNAADFERQKIALRERAEQRQSEKLSLEKQKFQRETAELFLKFIEDQEALRIASSSESNAAKIERLGQLMFGEEWKS